MRTLRRVRCRRIVLWRRDGNWGVGLAGWKCLNCGFITDPPILKNRLVQFQRADRPNAPVKPNRWTHTIADIAT